MPRAPLLAILGRIRIREEFDEEALDRHELEVVRELERVDEPLTSLLSGYSCIALADCLSSRRDPTDGTFS